MSEIKKVIVFRSRLAFFFILFFGGAIVYRIAVIQWIQAPKWQALKEEKLMDYRSVPATRGNIYSDNGSLLATSIPYYKVCMDPTVCEDKPFKAGIDSLAMLLSRYFGDMTPAGYRQKITKARREGKRYVVLSTESINYQGRKQMSAWPIFREGKNKGGAIFEKVERRFLPFGNLARRTIGFVNEDRKGAGLEFTFNNVLGGTDGKALFRKMSGGNWRPIHDDTEVRPEDGLDIMTTLDVNIQDVATASLERHLKAHDADFGCVVLMEVETGEIKAMANLGKTASGDYIENYNYAVGWQTEPGSTFKLASMIALSEETGFTLSDTVNTFSGAFKFYDRVMRDSKPEGYGVLTMKQAFAKSSNIAVSRKIMESFGSSPEAYLSYLEKMGLMDPVDFQIDGEVKPYFKSPDSKLWSGTTLPWMSIGYELKMTPLQMLTFYNAVANNGYRVQPILVKEIREAEHVRKTFEAKKGKSPICSERSLKLVRDMLEAVVDSGTADNIANVNYRIAGKTGTSQKLKDNNYTRTYTTTFAGYFPAERPKYSCIVIIDNPKGFHQYGSDVAAPVFREVADKIFSVDMDLHKPLEAGSIITETKPLPVIRGGYYNDLKYLCNYFGLAYHSEASVSGDWVRSSTNNNSVRLQPLLIQKQTVPNVEGMTLKDAFAILENMGWPVRYGGQGRVADMRPQPGTVYAPGQSIWLRLE